MDVVTQTRGKNVALGGLVLQTALSAVMVTIWLWTGSLSAMACAWVLSAGVALWVMLWLLFYCRQLQRRESLELEEIAARSQSSGIFQGPDQAELRPAARRLHFVERWAVPVFTLLWAGCHLAVGILMLGYLSPRGPARLANDAQGLLFCVLLAFVAFLFSRYATGMSTRPEYRPLRAGGSYLLANALLIVLVAAGLALATRGSPGSSKADIVLAYVFPIVQFVLAGELAMNFLLDLYRPRMPGQEQRLSFDSRLLDLLAEPQRVGHSIAETLNYQFGFEVSKTWFYQLVSKAVVPLAVFGAAVLVAMTSVVVVHEGEQAVVFHLGRMQPQPLGPGVHLRWPWPVDRTDRFDVSKVHEISLGVGKERSEAQRLASIVNGREIFLWTQEHGSREERDFLVAVPPRSVSAGAGGIAPPPVNIIKLVASLQYVIEEPCKYGYKYENDWRGLEPAAGRGPRGQVAARMLENAAYREMVQYCASATLDEPVPGGSSERPEAIMTFGRARAADELKRRIQKAVGSEGLDLGVRIISLGFSAIHPPSQAAGAYEEVLQAERAQDEQRYQAQAQANQVLADVAGDPAKALNLALSIRMLQELEDLSRRRADTGELLSRLQELIRSAGKEIEIIDREIERERLLGKLSLDRRTPMQQLRDRQVQYKELLERLQNRTQADPSSADLAAHIQAAYESANSLFDQATGEPARLVAQALAERWAREMAERALAEAFDRELMAYQASPNIYMLDRALDAWDEALSGAPKVVLGVDPDKIELRLNLEKEKGVLEEALTPAASGSGAP